jgi:hypothetical protein
MKVIIGPYGEEDQFVSIRIDKYDTWSLDTTMAKILVPALTQLRDTTHSYPGEFCADVEDTGMLKWQGILTEMIWSFEQCTIDSIDLFVDSDGVFDKEGLLSHQTKINKGLHLFAQYYQHLWD